MRVRKGNSLYLFTKKGEQPVYIRNEDESRPADAARLQALLAIRSVPGQAITPAAFGYTQPALVTQQIYVTQAQEGTAPTQRVRSETFLQVSLTPEEPLAVRLDLTVEQKLLSLVRSCYPELADNVDDRSRNLGASFTDNRMSDWYLITYLESGRDYEMRWGTDSAGGLIAFGN